MRLAGEAQAELIKLAALAAVGVVAYVLIKKAAESAAASASDAFDAFDKLLATPAKAWEAVKESAAEAVAPFVETASAVRAAAPGAGLPTGWYTVKTRWGNVVTRYPDSFKTINPYDTLGLIDP